MRLSEKSQHVISIRQLPLSVNLSTQLVPKLRFGNTLVLETLFRLSKLVNRNRVSLQPRSKIEILERVCGFFCSHIAIFWKKLKLTHIGQLP